MTDHKNSAKPSFMRWHPETGEPALYDSLAAVPEGHLDHHPHDPNYAKPTPVKVEKPKAEKVAADPNAMTRREIREALTEGNVEYDKTAETSVLAALLDEKVRAVLTEQGREFDANASTKELLGLLSPAE